MTLLLKRRFLSQLTDIRRLEQLIGHTPLYQLQNIFQKPGVQLFAKLEWQQLGGSVKARPAFQIIKSGLLNDQLANGRRLLDATSGNTGIAYGSIGAALGVPVTLCLPENASARRIKILQALGVEIVFTSPLEGTDGAQLKAKAMDEAYPDRYFYANQYANELNWQAHYLTTANEIWQQTAGRITHFVAGLGTSGTFVGTGRRLKELTPGVKLVALQPDNLLHALEGWKHLETAVVPKIYDPGLADQVEAIDTLEAHQMVKEVALKEGLLISPSAAANLVGVIRLARRIDQGVIVTTFADDASKYED